jgi:hypothetical protein
VEQVEHSIVAIFDITDGLQFTADGIVPAFGFNLQVRRRMAGMQIESESWSPYFPAAGRPRSPASPFASAWLGAARPAAAGRGLSRLGSVCLV